MQCKIEDLLRPDRERDPRSFLGRVTLGRDSGRVLSRQKVSGAVEAVRVRRDLCDYPRGLSRQCLSV